MRALLCVVWLLAGSPVDADELEANRSRKTEHYRAVLAEIAVPFDQQGVHDLPVGVRKAIDAWTRDR